jgi:hypothetical protein
MGFSEFLFSSQWIGAKRDVTDERFKEGPAEVLARLNSLMGHFNEIRSGFSSYAEEPEHKSTLYRKYPDIDLARYPLK